MMDTPTANCVAEVPTQCRHNADTMPTWSDNNNDPLWKVRVTRERSEALRVMLSSCLERAAPYREDLVVAHGLGAATLCELIEKPSPLTALLSDVTSLQHTWQRRERIPGKPVESVCMVTMSGHWTLSYVSGMSGLIVKVMYSAPPE